MKKILFAPLVATLMAASTQVHAAPRSFIVYGHVTQALPMAPLNAEVKIRFSYDDSAVSAGEYGDRQGPGAGSALYILKSKIKLKVNGHRVHADTTRVEVVNNYGGNVEDSVSVYGTPTVLDGTTFREGNFGFYLGSGPGNTGVLTSIALPRTINVKRFDAISMNSGWVRIDGSSDGTVVAFAVDRIKEGGNDQDDDD